MSVIVFVPIDWLAVNPVTDPKGKQEALQVKLLLVTSSISGMFSVIPEQSGDGWEFMRWGVGLTVTMYV